MSLKQRPEIQRLVQRMIIRENQKRRMEKNHKGLLCCDWFIFCIWLIIGLIFVLIVPELLPSVRDPSNYSEFSEERARHHVLNFTSFGPRPTGSEAAEVLSVNLLLRHFEETKKNFDETGKNRIEYDIQRPSDCFDISLGTFFTICYNNVTNVVARIGPKERPALHALMLNCHFDSVIGSPGATDDAISCAIMMELMTVYSRKNETLPYDIVFLFNGAEEYGLQASHGFIKYHPWRHTIRAFINLEGAGSGGREMLFQAGPRNSWLLYTYLTRVPHPFCNVLAQEIFQSGLIPSDTDFRIFRDFGRLSGLDIAYIKNGYVYHTEFDEPSRIQAGSIQRGGDNVLAVVEGIMSTPYLAKPGQYEEETRWVFYDYLGFFTIYYRSEFGELLTSVVCSVVMLIVFSRLSNRVYSINRLRVSLISQLLAFCGSILLCYVMAFVSVFLRIDLCWYQNPPILYLLFIIPCIAMGWKTHYNSRMNEKNTWENQLADLNCAMIICTILLLIMSYYKMASSFLFFNLSLSLLMCDILAMLLPKRHRTYRKMAAMQAVIITPVILYIFYLYHQILDIFIPILGRSGSRWHPIILLATLSVVVANLVVMLTQNFCHITGRIRFVRRLVYSSIILYILACSISDAGQTYRFTPEKPRLRRMIAFHTYRQFHDINDTIIAADNGAFIQGLDYNNVQNLPGFLLLDGNPPDCSKSYDIYCALPYYNAHIRNYPPSQTRWVTNVSQLEIENPLEVKLISKTLIDKNKVNCTIQISGGAVKASLHITPLNGLDLVSWSLTNIDFQKYRKQLTYYVSLVNGYKTPQDRTISMILENQHGLITNIEDPVLDFVTVSLVGHGPNQKSKYLKLLDDYVKAYRMQKRPSWAMTFIFGTSEIVSKVF